MGRSARFRPHVKLDKPIWPVALLAVLGLAAGLGVAGCGQSTTGRPPQLAGVPLAGGLRVIAHSHRCDRGANPYCAVQLVVVGGGGAASALLTREQQHLTTLGWTSSQGDTGKEQAADSPGHKLRLTYATASDDLQALDMGWIRRAPLIGRALSRTMFDRAPALSLMLQTGPS
jgi:hypothetical protein